MSTRPRPSTTTLLSGCYRGAALLVAATSVLGALGSGPVNWISSPLTRCDVWHSAVAATFLGLAAYPFVRRSRLARAVLALATAGMLFRALHDTAVFFQLIREGAVRNSLPIPLSVFVAGMLTWGLRIAVAESSVSEGTYPSFATLLLGLAGVVTGALAILLALIVTFGTTDYRRSADCAIVLGAGVYPDGTPSLALSDRVAEAVRLYREGLTEIIVMSGGIDPQGHSEPVVMRSLAISAGVPSGAILLDEQGQNTRASAGNCARIMKQRGLGSALVVSHYYHLARCKAAFRREGVRCFTVPARMTRRLAREPYYLIRECAAYLWYALP